MILEVLFIIKWQVTDLAIRLIVVPNGFKVAPTLTIRQHAEGYPRKAHCVGLLWFRRGGSVHRD